MLTMYPSVFLANTLLVEQNFGVHLGRATPLDIVVFGQNSR